MQSIKKTLRLWDRPRTNVIPSQGKGLPTKETVHYKKDQREQIKDLDVIVKTALSQLDIDDLKIVFKRYLTKVKQHKKKTRILSTVDPEKSSFLMKADPL